MSNTLKFFNGLPAGIEGDGGQKNWFNGLPAPVLSTQYLVAALYTDTDTIYAPTDTANVTLTASLYTDTDTFYAPTVSFTLTASLYTDTDTFYAPTVTPGAVTLTPSLYTDTDTFYAPSINGANGVTPGIVTDSDTFYAPTILEDQALAPSLYTASDTFYVPQVAEDQALAPSLYVDSDVIYAPADTAVYTLAPSLYVDSDTFYSPSLSLRGFMLPGLVDESAVIYPPVVGAAIGITASLVTDSDTIYSTTVRNGSTLTPPLLVDTDTFRVPVITTGPVSILPNRYNDLDIFYTPAVQLQSTQGGGGGGNGAIPANVKYATQFTMASAGLISALQIQSGTAYASTVHTRMMLYADNAGVPGALLAQSAVKNGLVIGTNTYPLTSTYSVLVGTIVWVAIHTDTKINVLGNSASGARYNTDTFSDGPTDPFGASSLDNKKAPVLVVLLSAPTASILPPLVASDDTFYAPTVAPNKTLTAPLITDTDFFYAPRLNLNVQPSLYADDHNISGTTDQIYSPTVYAVWVTLHPALFVDADVVSSPDVAAFSPTIFPPHVVDDDVLVIGDGINVTPQGANLLPSAFSSDDVLFTPVALNINTLLPPHHTSVDVIQSSTVSRGAVTLHPSLVPPNDQFWLEEVTLGVGTHTVQPPLVGSDDVVYSANRGSAPLFKRTIAIKGSTSLRSKTLTTRTANGINLIGDDSKVEIELEGNDA